VALSLSSLLGSDFIKFIDTDKNPNFPDRNFKTFAFTTSKASDILSNLQNQYPSSLTGYTLTPIKVEKTIEGKAAILDGLELTIKNFSQTKPALLNLALYVQGQEWVPECDWETFEGSSVKIKALPTSARDLKKLSLAQQKSLRKMKWDRLTKLQRELIQKHIGDTEFVNKLFNGESIDFAHFRDKWGREVTSFYDKTKKYYLY
jgi:hypothetical protein